MKPFLFVLFLVAGAFSRPELAHATCLSVKVTCRSSVPFSVEYANLIERCAAPGSMGSEKTTLSISHQFLGNLEIQGSESFEYNLVKGFEEGSVILEIKDNRGLEKDLSTNGPQSLPGYACTTKFN